MGKILKIQDFLAKRHDHSIKEHVKAVDEQISEAMETGSCDTCGQITSDLHEVNGEWVCTDCFKVGPFDIGA